MHTDGRMQSDFPQLDKVEILELLGQGARSRVYKARQRELDRVVAVKVLSAIDLSESALERFFTEAKLSCTLDHPNLLRVLSFGVSQNNQPFIVMEYVEGVTLSAYLQENRQMQLGMFRDIFIPLLSALAYAHARKLIHRDIKPANIMLCKNDLGERSVKLLDFGIAKVISDTEDAGKGLTKTGVLLGSPAYMSPEQCRGAAVDARSDLYSLSCVMYECLCGEPPFKADSVYELIQKHGSEAPPTVSELSRRIDIRRELAAMVLSGLAKDPERRPQSAEELSKMLNETLEKMTLEKVPRLKSEKTSAGQNLRLVAALAVVLTLTVVVFAALSFSDKGKSAKSEKRETLVGTANVSELMKEAEDFERKGDFANAAAKHEQEILELKHVGSVRKSELIKAYYALGRCFVGDKSARSGFPELRAVDDWRARAQWCFDRGFEIADDGKHNELRLVGIMEQVGVAAPEDLVKACEDAISRADRADGRKSQRALRIRDYVVLQYLQARRFDRAEQAARDYSEVAKGYLGSDAYPVLRAQAMQALILAATKRAKEARELTLKIQKRLLDSSTRLVASPGARAAIYTVYLLPACYEISDGKLAEQLIENELAVGEVYYPDDPKLLGELRVCLGLHLSMLGLREKSIKYYEEAERILYLHPGDSIALKDALLVLIADADQRKDKKSAAEYRRKYAQRITQGDRREYESRTDARNRQFLLKRG